MSGAGWLHGLALALAVLAALATTASAQASTRRPRPFPPEQAAHLRAVARENVVLVLATAAAGAVLAGWALSRRRSRTRLASDTPIRIEQWDLAVVEVALAREHVASLRRELDEILASRLNARDVLPELANALARAPWSHVGMRQYPRVDAPIAEQRHRAVQTEIAARETLEVPPEPGRGYRGEPMRDEPEEHALVSLLVLTRAELPEALGAPPDAARRTLESLARRPTSEIVQVDVTWFPPGAGETTTTRDLLARAPRLVPA
ncbi:DUF1517 domain-containing protein [Sandaracinus amylolyticus]|uniref:Uncharacterized protein n=1 Tax=Sandaracinus amylolyticus TaxID=927083 RepID=A0A0F6SER7_9BACT|nr:DUF1517 domain-containing protein [Sandaracinus amylolyticus]AKF05664.1 hypothetical protein DB32_002813 [Sandaracinus amylolyticus]